MSWWDSWWGVDKKEEGLRDNENWNTLLEVRKAHSEWVSAHLMFDEALGQDQIDYAIYMLEAAERKYQIHLKHAKNLGLNSSRL